MDKEQFLSTVKVKLYEIDSEKKVPLHQHKKEDEIFHCIKGSGVGIVGDKEITLNVGDTFTARAGEMHSMRTDDYIAVTAILIPVE